MLQSELDQRVAYSASPDRQLFYASSTIAEVQSAQVTIEKILVTTKEAVLQSLPSIRRVQKVYGPFRHGFDSQQFLQAVGTDIVSFVGLSNGMEIANQAIRSLIQIEAALLGIGRKKAQLITRDIREDVLEAYETTVDVADEFAAKAVWENWEPGEYGDLSLTDSIILKLLANLKYLEGNVHRRAAATKTHSFEENQKNRADHRYDAKLSSLVENQHWQVTASAEDQMMLRELQEEFFQIVVETSDALMLEHHLNGYTTEEISEMFHVTLHEVEIRIQKAMQEAAQLAEDKYGWEPQDIARFTYQSTTTNGEGMNQVESGLDFSRLSKGLGLEEIFARIDTLPDLMKKCVLFRIGYLEDQFGVPTETWIDIEHISMHTYLKQLRTAFGILISPVNDAKRRRTIREIVDSVSGYESLIATSGRLVAESSAALALAKREQPFPVGSLTQDELNLVKIIKEQWSSGKILGIRDLSQLFHWAEAKTYSLLYRLSQVEASQPRYATEEYMIKRESARFALIQWYELNKHTGEIYQLSRLTPEQLKTFWLVVSLNGDHYLSDDEINNRLLGDHRSSKEAGLVELVKGAVESLNRLPSYVFLRNDLAQALADNQYVGKQAAIARLALERLEAHQSLVLRAVRPDLERLQVSKSLWLVVLQRARQGRPTSSVAS